MLRSMLDTNACIRIIRQRPTTIIDHFRRESGALAISAIVHYELSFGAANSDRPNDHRALLEDFASRLEVLPFDGLASEHAADIRLDLSRKGRIIGPIDILIAGHARSLGLKLITGNLREFTRVEGLRCEDWF